MPGSASAREAAWAAMLASTLSSSSEELTASLTWPSVGELPGAPKLHPTSHDPDEAVVVLPDLARQLVLVLRHVLQPVQVVAELAELAQDPVQHSLVRGQER